MQSAKTGRRRDYFRVDLVVAICLVAFGATGYVPLAFVGVLATVYIVASLPSRTVWFRVVAFLAACYLSDTDLSTINDIPYRLVQLDRVVTPAVLAAETLGYIVCRLAVRNDK
jgi:hypothetical protein